MVEHSDNILSTLLLYVQDSILLIAIIVFSLIVFPKYRQLTKDRIAAERQAVKDRIEADEKMWQRWGEREAKLLNVINECTSVMSGLREVISMSVRTNTESIQIIFSKIDQMNKGDARIEAKIDTLLQNQWSIMGESVLKKTQDLQEEFDNE